MPEARVVPFRIMNVPFRFYCLAFAGALFSVTVPAPAQSPVDTSPHFAWATAAGGAAHDKTRCVAVDAQGNSYLTGEMSGEAKFGDILLKSAGQLDFFVAKVDPAGKFLWARRGGGTLTDRGYGVVPDAEGNCYVTGHYQSTDAEFEGRIIGNSGGYDVFVAKYDHDGQLVWIHDMGGGGYDYGHAIAVDSHGDVVVAGALVIGGSLSYHLAKTGGGISGTAVDFIPSLKSPSGQPFCAKYSSEGKLQWLKFGNGNMSGSIHGIAVDAKDNIYLGGAIAGTGEFGSKPLGSAKGQSSLVMKMSPEGEALWVAQEQGEPSCGVHELTADAQGRVWVCGMFKGKATFGSETFSTTGDKDNDAFLAHYDTNGKLQWVRVGQGPAVDYGLGVATDGKGNAFLTGEFTADFKLAGATLTSRGATDVYIAKFDNQGALTWLTQAGGDKGDNAYTMAHLADGSLVLAGSFGGTVTFGDKSVSSSGGNDLYVAKLVPPVK